MVQLNNNKNQLKKWQRTRINISPKKIKSKKIHEKISTFQPLGKCKSKPQGDTTSYLLRMIIIEKKSIEDVEKLGHLCIAGRNVKWCTLAAI